MRRYQHILAATDFSELGDRAVAQATSLAIAANAKLTIVHVIPTQDYPLSSYAHYEVSEHLSEVYSTRAGAEEALQERIAPEAAAASIEVKTVLREGEPAAEIAELIRQCGADLAVVATHGRRGIRRVILGSVTEMLVRESSDLPADVLVIS